ncbi:MAG: eCIS core domain-containing protein [Lewinella sp.]|uniref:eCIS core domain-containing protein n=1 Tax=Lewinella sp. TaxID=2004506 RepID=UPI003D6BA8A7
MYSHVKKSRGNEHEHTTPSQLFQKDDTPPAVQFKDNREETIAQRKLQAVIQNGPQQAVNIQLQALPNQYSTAPEQPIQKKENNTGLPDNLKTGVENLSGIAMDDVKVHYNSGKPAQMQAHAYAQNTDIHVAPGQEKYLPHEAWHVVQQKQGRVKPTAQLMGKVNINDDCNLEREADVMGGRALQASRNSQPLEFELVDKNAALVQRMPESDFKSVIGFTTGPLSRLSRAITTEDNSKAFREFAKNHFRQSLEQIARRELERQRIIQENDGDWNNFLATKGDTFLKLGRELTDFVFTHFITQHTRDHDVNDILAHPIQEYIRQGGTQFISALNMIVGQSPTQSEQVQDFARRRIYEMTNVKVEAKDSTHITPSGERNQGELPSVRNIRDIVIELPGSGDLHWRTEKTPDDKGEMRRSKPHMRLPVFVGRQILPMVYQRVQDNERIFTIAGPMGLGGISNSGDRSISKNLSAIDHILALIRSNAEADHITGISLRVKAHSRNAVAAAYAVQNIQERYPVGPGNLINNLQVVMHDPVPGFGSEGDYPNRRMPQHPHIKTVVVYSIAAQDHRFWFDPLQIDNANVLVLTDDAHVGGVLKRFRALDQQRGQETTLVNLPDGVYGAVNSHNVDVDHIVRLNNDEEVKGFIDARFDSAAAKIKDTGFKTTRRNAIVVAANSVLRRQQQPVQ